MKTKHPISVTFTQKELETKLWEFMEKYFPADEHGEDWFLTKVGLLTLFINELFQGLAPDC